jgi:hypothetical protein
LKDVEVEGKEEKVKKNSLLFFGLERVEREHIEVL